MLTAADIVALTVTLKLAAFATVSLLILGVPLAWWLANTSWRYKFVCEALIALPLILPPTVLGFYLLLAMGPDGPLGKIMSMAGGQPLAFTFTGLLIGSVFYSLPFVVQPIQNAFESMGKRPMEVAATLGAGPLDRFFSVALPLARPGILTASVLGFAHTIGEFGVVLMIGGNIPGETQVASIAIYEHVESLDYVNAHLLSACLLAMSFILLLLVYGLNRRSRIMLP